MKRKILLFVSLLSIAWSHAQVGINTKYPRGVFHIDGLEDNPTDGVTPITPIQALNDVLINSVGNLGIGTINPSVKVDINTGGTSASPIEGFRLIDGNEGPNKVLTSDANGLATWKAIGFSEYNTIMGNIKTLNLVTSQVFYYTGHSFALKDKGTYLITVGAQLLLYSDDKDLLGRLRIPIQMKPTNNPGDWSNSSQRFSGAYEAYPTQGIPILEVNDPQGKYILDFRYYINQAITSEIDNQVVYLLLWTSEPVNIQATLTLGETGAQGSGGAYVRIN